MFVRRRVDRRWPGEPSSVHLGSPSGIYVRDQLSPSWMGLQDNNFRGNEMRIDADDSTRDDAQVHAEAGRQRLQMGRSQSGENYF